MNCSECVCVAQFLAVFTLSVPTAFHYSCKLNSLGFNLAGYVQDRKKITFRRRGGGVSEARDTI